MVIYILQVHDFLGVKFKVNIRSKNALLGWGGRAGKKKQRAKKNNHDEPFFKNIYQKFMKFINSQFLKTHILKHHHATSKHIALASKAFG